MYIGVVYNHNSVNRPDLAFQVEYYNGSSGLVRGGDWVDGETNSIRDRVYLQFKICEAKELVDWSDLQERFGIEKEEMLRIAWLMNSKQPNNS